ncbi:MAG TPA: hypothetical protein VGI74_13755 [Streptosporangiaceae bacterium]
MGQKTVRFSDLSGQLILDDSALARIVVHEHPELGESPVEIEAVADEVTTIEKEGVQVAVVDLYFPGDEQPHRVAMDVDAFDRLATDKPMSELLASARPAKRAARAATTATARDSRVSYATLEHAGKPHKGKTTDAEKQLVHDHLDEINERLSADGMRAISLDDPEHVERYGLADLVADEPGTGAQQSLGAIDEFDAA